MDNQYYLKQNDIEAKLESNTQKWTIGICVAILTLILNFASWGTHLLEIRWVQLRDVSGMGSVQSFDRMAAICTELKKYDCIEYAYKRASQIDKTKTKRFAEFLVTRRKFKDAALWLSHYIKTSKQIDAPAMQLYAKVLSELGRSEEALGLYEQIIQTQKRVFQPEIIHNYVKELAKAKRYSQAQALILRTRKAHSRVASRFMEQEFRILGEINTRRQISSVR